MIVSMSAQGYDVSVDMVTATNINHGSYAGAIMQTIFSQIPK